MHISPINSYLRTAKKKTPHTLKTRAIQKSLSLKKKVKTIIWKAGRRMGQKQKKDKTEGATGLGRITTREQIEKWNQTRVIRSVRPPFGPSLERFWRR